MGVSAARMLGAVSRMLATAVVAVPSQHRPIALTDRWQVRFVRRDTAALDAERVETPLGPALVTTPEQAVLDLARAPGLGQRRGGGSSSVETLYRRSDSARLRRFAADQRLGAALQRSGSARRSTHHASGTAECAQNSGGRVPLRRIVRSAPSASSAVSEAS
jgi:hypothetical protein